MYLLGGVSSNRLSAMPAQVEMDHFSISQLQTYLNCPASYYYSYVEKLDWEFQPADMVFGKICHQVIAEFHQTPMTKEEMVVEFERRWGKAVDETTNLRFRSLDDRQLATRGKQLAELYYDQYNSLVPEDVEMFFEIPLLDLATGEFGEQVVQGRIDLIADSTVYEIKTSSRSLNQSDADNSLQLTFYAWAYQYLYSKPAKELKIVNLVKTKEPKIQALSTRRNLSDFTKLYHLMTGTIRAIQQDVFYPNPLSRYGCEGCPFQNACGKEGLSERKEESDNRQT